MKANMKEWKLLNVISFNIISLNFKTRVAEEIVVANSVFFVKPVIKRRTKLISFLLKNSNDEKFIFSSVSVELCINATNFPNSS